MLSSGFSMKTGCAGGPRAMIVAVLAAGRYEGEADQCCTMFSSVTRIHERETVDTPSRQENMTKES